MTPALLPRWLPAAGGAVILHAALLMALPGAKPLDPPRPQQHISIEFVPLRAKAPPPAATLASADGMTPPVAERTEPVEPPRPQPPQVVEHAAVPPLPTRPHHAPRADRPHHRKPPEHHADRKPDRAPDRHRPRPPHQKPEHQPPPTAVSSAVVAAVAPSAVPLATPPAPPQTAPEGLPDTGGGHAAEQSAAGNSPEDVVKVSAAMLSKRSNADYVDVLFAKLEQHRQYPRRARLTNTEGTVLLRFRIDRDGNLLAWNIARSSGSALLDKAVEDMITAANPLPRVPADFAAGEGTGRSWEFVLPISFRLLS